MADWFDIILTAVGASFVAMVSTWWFLYRRGLEPSSELEVQVNIAGVQDGQMLLEVIALLANKSAVRQYYQDFQLSVRYLLPSDTIADGPEQLGHQLMVPNSIDARIGAKRSFAYAEYIDPGVTFRHSYITFVPASATFLWLHTKLKFRTRKHWHSTSFEWHRKSTQRLVAVSQVLESSASEVGAHRQVSDA